MHIISVSYFGSSSIPPLLKSLQNQTNPDWSLWVVDNSCSEEESANIQTSLEHESRAKLIRAPSNLGYFGAAQWFLENHGEIRQGWACISNVDLELPDKDFLEKLSLLDPLRVGVIAPSIVSSRSGLDQNPFMVARPTTREMARRKLFLSRPSLAQVAVLASSLKEYLLRYRRQSRVEQPKGSIYAGHGSFMIFTPRFFSAGGSFKHETFLYGEEITIAELCRSLDLRVEYNPSLQVKHVAHGQIGFIRSRRVLRYQGDAARMCYTLISRNT